MENSSSEDVLLRKLSTALNELKKNVITTSTTLDVLKLNSTKRKQYFHENSFTEDELNLTKAEESQLIKDAILFKMDEARNKLTLTIKGIILLEYGLDRSGKKMSDFLNALNESYFLDLMGRVNEPLESQEKGVILTLLGLHAFTKETAVKLSAYNESVQNMNLFKSCVDDTLGYFKSLGEQYIDSNMDKIWSLNVIGENPVAARINRLNKISLKTDQIYKKGDGNHFLDVLKDGKLDKDRVTFLLRKIFDKRTLNFEERESLVALTKSIQSKRYKLINTNHDFDNSEIGYVLHTTIEEFKTV